MRLSLQSLIYYLHKKKNYVMSHHHECYELVYYCSGNGQTMIDAHSYKIEPDTVTLIAPGEKHEDRFDEDTQVYCLTFDQLESDFPLSSIAIYNKPANRQILRILQAMLLELNDRTAIFSNAYLDALLQQLIYLLLRQYPPKLLDGAYDRPEERCVRFAQQYMKENYFRSIDLNLLARSLGYSYDRFRHLFTLHCGDSPYQYLIHLRIQQAKRMLEETTDSIKSIALSAGFHSSSRFHKAFTQQIGVPPQRYRQAVAQQIDFQVLNLAFPESSPNRTPVLLDTDIGSDCDDAGAMALMYLLCAKGEAVAAAIVHSTSQPHGVAYIDTLNRFYHQSEVPVGACSAVNPAVHIGVDFAGIISTLFPVARYKPAADAVQVARRALLKQRDHSAAYICIGPMTVLAALLASPGDESSPLSGYELFLQKVSRVVVMGGDFAPGAAEEYNIQLDVPAAQYAAARCPVPMVFCDYQLGAQVLTGAPYVERDIGQHPVALAYRLFAMGRRPGWDQQAVLYGVRGCTACYRLSQSGTVRIDERGVTTFCPSQEGKHFLLLPNASAEAMAAEIDGILSEEWTQPEERKCSVEPDQ